MSPTARPRGSHACPHCAGPAKIRSARQISATYREVYLDCYGNPECGWRGAASFVIERTIAQSARPNPEVSLPVTPARRRFTIPPPPANDDRPGSPGAEASR